LLAIGKIVKEIWGCLAAWVFRKNIQSKFNIHLCDSTYSY
jgi:hypothetical protein